MSLWIKLNNKKKKKKKKKKKYIYIYIYENKKLGLISVVK